VDASHIAALVADRSMAGAALRRASEVVMSIPFGNSRPVSEGDAVGSDYSQWRDRSGFPPGFLRASITRASYAERFDET
jgi:hypothetical protein